MSFKGELAELVPQPSLSIRVVTSAQDLPDVFANDLSEIMHYLQEFKQQTAGHPYVTHYNFDTRNLEVKFGIAIQ